MQTTMAGISQAKGIWIHAHMYMGSQNSLIFYNLTGTTTAKEQNRKKWRKYSGKVRRYELSLANDIARIERTGDSTYTDVQFSRYMISIYNDSLQYLKRIQDDIVALDYSVQIEYYHPTIKVNVTQEKKVTLKALQL